MARIGGVSTIPTDPEDPTDAEPIDELFPDREWDRVPVLPALGLVLLGVVWMVFLVWPRPPADDSADAGFLRDMIVHHNQAVTMAQIAHDGTEDPAVSVLSIDIAGSQQLQVGTMFGWLDQWGLPPNSDRPAMAWTGTPVEGPMPGMATAEDIARLQTLTGAELDVEFLRLMTLHHIAGADMGTACVDLCDDDEVIRLARSIATTQDGEIELMNRMLVERGQPAVTTDDGMASMPGMQLGGGSMAEAVAPTSGGALRTVVGKAVRTLPVVFGLVALVWLVVDAARRRRDWPGDLDAPPEPILAGLGGAAVSAALHAGLVPGYLDLRTDLGLFHAAVVVVQAAVVATQIGHRRRDLTLAAAAVGLAVIAAWAVLRLVAPADDDGRYDLALTLTMVAEAVQAGALFWAWRQTAAPDGHPAPVPADG